MPTRNDCVRSTSRRRARRLATRVLTAIVLAPGPLAALAVPPANAAVGTLILVAGVTSTMKWPDAARNTAGASPRPLRVGIQQVIPEQSPTRGS
jgi:hypothetical protein